MPRPLLAALAAALVALPAGAQDAPRPASMMHAYGMAAEAAAARDYPRAVERLRDAERFSPGHPFVLRALARMQARAGALAAAESTLARLATVGAADSLEADSALAPLVARPGWGALRARLRAAAAPVVRSDTAAVVPDPDLIPESVAHDAGDGAFYVGSLARRKVVRVTRGGTSDFTTTGQDGLGRVLGIRVQPGTRRLWVANWLPDPAAPRSIVGDHGWAQLHVYDLATGRLAWKAALRDTAAAQMLNDVAFAPSGDAYLTDSHGGRVYRVRAGRDSLERLDDGATRLTYPNGLAWRRGALVVADVEGLVRFDVATGRGTRVQAAPAEWPGLVDGLYACGDDLVAVQGTVDGTRIVRLALDAGATAVRRLTTLERGHPAAGLPTTGVMLGGTLVYIADSQLRRLQADDTLTPAATPRETVLLRLPIAGGCRR